jgi:hypothetical protein
MLVAEVEDQLLMVAAALQDLVAVVLAVAVLLYQELLAQQIPVAELVADQPLTV